MRSTDADPRRARSRISTADFAIGAGLLALHWLVHGYGYEVTGADVWSAYSSTLAAAQMKGNVPAVREQVRQIIAAEAPGGFVTRVLRAELEPVEPPGQ